MTHINSGMEQQTFTKRRKDFNSKLQQPNSYVLAFGDLTWLISFHNTQIYKILEEKKEDK
jgi:hypothetical protein